MKKNYALLLAVAVSVSAMAFRPSPQVDTKAEVTRIRTAEQAASNRQITKVTETTKCHPLIWVALEVDTKVLIVTALGYLTRMIDAEVNLDAAGKYKAILKDIDMRSLDKKIK